MWSMVAARVVSKGETYPESDPDVDHDATRSKDRDYDDRVWASSW